MINKLIEKGGADELVMFLSGMGGTGKSEVINAFVYFDKGVSNLFDRVYDQDVIKIIALIGAAACEIPNGKTLHSQACLSVKRIDQNHRCKWKSTNMVIIDEVSFLNANLIKALDRKIGLLKEAEALYGKVYTVFIGNFF